MIRQLLFRSMTGRIVWTCAIALMVVVGPGKAFATTTSLHQSESYQIDDAHLLSVTAPAYTQSPGSAAQESRQVSALPIAVAQAVTPTSTPTPRPTLTVTPTTTATVTGTLASETGQQATPRRTTVVNSLQLPGLNPTPTAVITTTPTVTSTVDIGTGTTEAADEEPLEGTILANRTTQAARFFIEGETIELGASRATSFTLSRPTTVLNLYNCAASTPESNTDCYWDPYVLQRDGFYEIYQSRPAGVNTVARLMLRTADAPPTDQIWVQNRTSNVESIVFRNEVIELEPTAVEEFAVDPGLPAILYMRRCITLQGQSACEWAPKSLEAGIYYALTELIVAGTVANSTITTIDLRPVVGAAGDGDLLVEESGQVLCTVQVPTLNIRSGPGLQYQIVGKIFSTETAPGEVIVVGRNADFQWYAVDPAVMPNGWVTASESFVVCQGDSTMLPLVEAPPLPAEPAPVVVAPQPAEPAPADSDDAVPPADGTATPAQPGETPVDDTAADAPDGTPTADMPTADVPDGYSVLMLYNGFEHDIRFTIDQQYRPETGPSETDLTPGQSARIVVFPGRITFSASSPWGGGLSGNALINVPPDVVQPLWLRFTTDTPGGPASSWRLVWE